MNWLFSYTHSDHCAEAVFVLYGGEVRLKPDGADFSNRPFEIHKVIAVCGNDHGVLCRAIQ